MCCWGSRGPQRSPDLPQGHSAVGRGELGLSHGSSCVSLHRLPPQMSVLVVTSRLPPPLIEQHLGPWPSVFFARMDFSPIFPQRCGYSAASRAHVGRMAVPTLVGYSVKCLSSLLGRAQTWGTEHGWFSRLRSREWSGLG